jgi:glycosyltransferase involved in cell wall biosynthesis
MARAMLARGHAVAVFVGGQGPAGRRLAESGAAVHAMRFLRRPIRPYRDLRALLELTAALRDFRPDLVSTHTAKAGWIGRAAAARLGVPAIHTPHGLPVGDRMPGPRGALFRTAERIAGRWARAIICVCEHERRLALRLRLAPPDRLLVVHNGVGEIPDARRANPGATPVRVVSVARFEEPKDHAALLRAMASLRGLDWELELVGDGPLESSSRALAAKLGIADRVRFAGYCPDVAEALGRAQIFVLSSRSEALPRSVLEAMRAGLPVVAGDAGGLPETIENGANGILTPRGSHEALAVAVAKLIEDGGLRLRLGAAARVTYEQRFRLELMIEKTAAIYELVSRGASISRADG